MTIGTTNLELEERIRLLEQENAELRKIPVASELFTVCIDWPPSINEYWKVGGRGKRYMTDRGKTFREVSIVLIRNQLSQYETNYDRLAVYMDLAPPTHRECDLDNFLKAPIDVLEHARLIGRDSQVDHLSISRLPVASPGACVMKVCSLGRG